MFYWVLKTVVLGPILKLLFRPWVEGEENIPDDGAAIFASNAGEKTIFLTCVTSSEMTDERPTSDPVPAVVGTATK